MFCVLQVHRDMQMSREAMQVVCDFVSDMQQRLCEEATVLLRNSKRKQLDDTTFAQATNHLLSGELCRHAVESGWTAVKKHKASYK